MVSFLLSSNTSELSVNLEHHFALDDCYLAAEFHRKNEEWQKQNANREFGENKKEKAKTK